MLTVRDLIHRAYLVISKQNTAEELQDFTIPDKLVEAATNIVDVAIDMLYPDGEPDRLPTPEEALLVRNKAVELLGIEATGDGSSA